MRYIAVQIPKHIIFTTNSCNNIIMTFKNKVVLITGGGSGIRAATAKLFSKENAKVAIVGRNGSKLTTVAEKWATIGTKPLVIIADITNPGAVNTVVQRTLEEFGSIDVLINNAAIVKTDRILDDDFMKKHDEVMETNVTAILALTQQAVAHLIKSKGIITNISSIAGVGVCCLQYTSYSISKAVLNEFTKCIALELAPAGVRMNSIIPGPVRTDILESAGIKGSIEDSAKTTLLGKIADAEEVAELILYLCSDKAKGITGSLFVMDNGKLLK